MKMYMRLTAAISIVLALAGCVAAFGSAANSLYLEADS